MDDFTKAFFNNVKKDSGQEGMQFPPPVMEYLDPTLLNHTPEKSIKWSFPIKASYNNPFGSTFGGYYSMFFDAAFGPFSGITCQKPTTSLDLNVTFLKPLFPKDKEVIIEVEVISKSKTYIILSGKAYKGEEKILVATCTSRLLILNR